MSRSIKSTKKAKKTVVKKSTVKAVVKAVKKKGRKLTQEQIDKMQAGRRAAKAAAANEGPANITTRVPGQPIASSRIGATRIVQISTVFDPNMQGPTPDAPKGGIWMFGLGDDNKVYYWSFSRGIWMPNWLTEEKLQQIAKEAQANAAPAVDPLS